MNSHSSDDHMKFNINNSEAVLKEATGSIIIPKTIFEKNKEYIVSDIYYSALLYVKSVEFAPDTQISRFKCDLFNGSLIERLSIPKSIDTLEDGWCQNVKFLTKITISPENKHFKYIDNKIIVGKSNPNTGDFNTIIFARRDITSITIPSFIEHILPYSFENCEQLKTINFDSNSKVKILRSYSFTNSGIENFICPKIVEKIESFCFSNCQKLKTVNFESESKLNLIEKFAFQNSSLAKIFIPKHAEITPNSLKCCYSLSTIKISPENKNYKYLDDRFIVTESKTGSFDKLVFARSFGLSKLVIPSYINSFCDECFNLFRCESVEYSTDTKLRSINDGLFGNSEIKTIKIPSNFTKIGKDSFKFTKSLTTIIFDSNNSMLESIGISAFYGSTIESITIPKSVKSIDQSAFEASAIKSITIPQSVKSIGKSAFERSAIKSITIPNSVKLLNQSTFCGSAIESITIPQNIQSIENDCFKECRELKTVTFEQNSTLESIGKSAFEKSAIESITIPKSVKSIGESAFKRSAIKSITISKSVKLLNQSTFCGSAIESITIPQNIQSIENYCFDGCSKLKAVTFEQNSMLKTIGQFAFKNSGIDSINIPPSVEDIGSLCFYECKFLKTINFDLNSKLAVINDKIISFTNVTKFCLPPSVTEIKTEAFAFCEKLDVFEIPLNSKLETISQYAFTTDPFETYRCKFSFHKSMKIVSPMTFIKKILTLINEEDYYVDRTYFPEIEIIDENIDLDEIADFSEGFEVISMPNAKKIHIGSDFEHCIFQVPSNALVDSEKNGIEEYIEYIEDKKSSFRIMKSEEFEEYYQIIKNKKPVGIGSTSIVYKVPNPKIEKEFYALKIYKQTFISKTDEDDTSTTNKNDNDDDDWGKDDNEEEEANIQIDVDKMKLFFSEYEILTNLNHQNITKAYSFFFGDEKHPTPSILLEYFGHSLSKSFKKLKKIDLVGIIYEIADAMKYAHECNLIHRDLKPENILLDDQKHVKISDFGISTFIDTDTQKRTQTRTHGIGTLAYMAPELFDASKPYNEKVDVYAFGIVIYFILSNGKLPEINIADVLKQKEIQIPKSINKLSSKLIKDCCNFNYKKRPSFARIVDIIKENNFSLIDGLDDQIDCLKDRLTLT